MQGVYPQWIPVQRMESAKPLCKAVHYNCSAVQCSTVYVLETVCLKEMCEGVFDSGVTKVCERHGRWCVLVQVCIYQGAGCMTALRHKLQFEGMGRAVSRAEEIGGKNERGKGGSV